MNENGIDIPDDMETMEVALDVCRSDYLTPCVDQGWARRTYNEKLDEAPELLVKDLFHPRFNAGGEFNLPVGAIVYDQTFFSVSCRTKVKVLTGDTPDSLPVRFPDGKVYRCPAAYLIN